MLDEVKLVYFTSGANIAALVNNIDDTNQISTAIGEKFNTLEQEITKFNNNLYDGITINPELVRPIHDVLKELSILFSADPN